MKSIVSLRAALGISQEKLALLLNIKRSRLAAIESDRRELPREAYELLRELESHVVGARHLGKTKAESPGIEQLHTQHRLLAWEMEGLVMAQARIGRKIEALEKKQLAQRQGRHRAELGKSLQAKNDKLFPLYKEIERDGNASSRNDFSGAKLLLELEREALALKKGLFEAKLKEIASRIEKTSE